MSFSSISGGRTVLIVLSVVLIGCADAADPITDDIAPFARWDSAGVMIAETANDAAFAPISWRVADEPSLQIGSIAGDESELFTSISGVARAGDNTVIVDSQFRDVRFFGPGGEFLLRVFGVRGRGPGEFQAIGLVHSPSVDSLVLWDSGNGRFTLLAPDGSGFRTVRRGETGRDGEASEPFVTPLTLIGQMLLIQSMRSDRSDFADRGVMDMRHPLWLEHLSDGKRVELGEFAGFRFLHPLTGAELARDLSMRSPLPPMVPPFTTPFSAAPAESSFVVTKGTGPEILRFSEDGALLSVMRIRKPRPVTASDVEAFVEWRAQALDSAGDMRSGLRDMVGRLPTPEVWPGFERLLVDTEGWTWAQLYHYDPSRSNTWVVFDPAGRAQGTVETPPRLDIHFIGEDFILGVARDELNVQFVREYALERGASATP